MKGSVGEVLPEYKSGLENWYAQASVRVKPRRRLEEEEEMGKTFFPADLVVIAQHPLVCERGPAVQRELMIRHLYRYLDFTTSLEHELVNSAVRRIVTKGTDFNLPDAMLFDAYKLYCDEAYHALFSEDLKRQICERTRILPAQRGEPSFLQWFRKLQADHSPDLSGLLEIFFAVVSETLITATLVQVPRDRRVVTAVRELIADHALDEAIHHKYFSHLFRTVWPQLGTSQKRILGPLLPEFTLQFLQPDLEGAVQNLLSVGMDRETAEQVVSESYPRERVQAGIRSMARATLRLFDEQEVRKDLRTAEAFDACGLGGQEPPAK